MSETSPETRKSRQKRLIAYFLQYKLWFLVGAIFLLVTNALALAIPRLIGDAVELLRETGDLDSVYPKLVTLSKTIVMLAIGAGTARIFSRVLIFNAGRVAPALRFNGTSAG